MLQCAKISDLAVGLASPPTSTAGRKAHDSTDETVANESLYRMTGSPCKSQRRARVGAGVWRRWALDHVAGVSGKGFSHACSLVTPSRHRTGCPSPSGANLTVPGSLLNDAVGSSDEVVVKFYIAKTAPPQD
jgi:hypothetical protein